MSIILVLALAVPFARAESVARQLDKVKTQISLADARGRIDKAIETPAVMRAIMKHLSPADQKQFVADVNKAIADMPASAEEKAAKFLNVNHAAVAGAAKGNVSVIIAEVFATVSPEALTVISERFASDLLGRTGPGKIYTDAQFEQISTELMKKINDRCEETDNGSPRAAFAIAMLVKASGGTPADLSDKLIDTLIHEDARDLAKNEWIPAALGLDGREQSYEPLLASSDAGRRPDLDFALVIAGPQFHDSVLGDLFGKNTDPMSYMRTRTPILDAVESALIAQRPILGGNIGGDVADAGMSRPQEGDIAPDNRELSPDNRELGPDSPEPGPYGWGNLR